MKRSRMTFAASHAMASAPGGSQPGVTVDDYARHVLALWTRFGEDIVAGAVAHMWRAGMNPERPDGMSIMRWIDVNLTVEDASDAGASCR